MKKKFKHNQLNFDCEKLMSYDWHKLSKCTIVADGQRHYTIDVNDSSYFYDNSHDRNRDYQIAKQIFNK